LSLLHNSDYLAEGAVAAIATAIATVHETSFGAARISTSVSRSPILPVGRCKTGIIIMVRH